MARVFTDHRPLKTSGRRPHPRKLPPLPPLPHPPHNALPLPLPPHSRDPHRKVGRTRDHPTYSKGGADVVIGGGEGRVGGGGADEWDTGEEGGGWGEVYLEGV